MTAISTVHNEAMDTRINGLTPLEASSLHICYYALENMTEHNMGLPQIFRHVMVPTKLLSDVTRG